MKTACVVGSEGGIGSAVVRRLAADGWTQIVRMDRGGPVDIDVSSPASVAAAFDEARRQVDRLDLLVITSGILDHGKLDGLTLARWNEVLAVNLTGPFLCCQAARAWLANAGRIVLVGSLAGRTGGVLTGTAYAVSKGGIESLTKSMAQELAPRQITVNCVAPGGVETAMLARNTPEARAGMVAATPLGRVATPDEVAATILFLASKDAGFITGAVVPVNGGLRMD